jgi:hypothetical protein
MSLTYQWQIHNITLLFYWNSSFCTNVVLAVPKIQVKEHRQWKREYLWKRISTQTRMCVHVDERVIYIYLERTGLGYICAKFPIATKTIVDIYLSARGWCLQTISLIGFFFRTTERKVTAFVYEFCYQYINLWEKWFLINC